ncbi:MAG TPA: MFS transporter [Methylomirabilota bacterium]|nr:MFS transporter [Methylomirabilota bacterium]
MGRTRLAVSTLFFVNGAVLASWLPHIPAVKARLTSGDGQLGLVLLAMAAGAVVALPAAGWLIGRLGSRVVSSAAAAVLCVAMPLPVLSPSLPALVLALAVLGAFNALLDVSMNAQAAAVEQRAGRAIMSSFHALFSLGGVVGALLASGAMAAGMGDVAHVVAAAVLALAGVGVALPGLLPASPELPPAGAALARPSRALLGLGMLASLGLLAEGAMADWSAVYLHDTLGAGPATAAVGFAAFSLAMAAGRFGGDGLVGRLGPRAVLRGSGAVAAGGLAAALLIGHPAAGIAGCALVGLGIANIIPVLFSAAARVPGVEPGRALAAVATTGYLGFLAGPPLIGVVAEAAGLALGLALVSAACAIIAVRSRVLFGA